MAMLGDQHCHTRLQLRHLAFSFAFSFMLCRHRITGGCIPRLACICCLPARTDNPTQPAPRPEEAFEADLPTEYQHNDPAAGQEEEDMFKIHKLLFREFWCV
jgi:hypothetical protein